MYSRGKSSGETAHTCMHAQAHLSIRCWPMISIIISCVGTKIEALEGVPGISYALNLIPYP